MSIELPVSTRILCTIALATFISTTCGSLCGEVKRGPSPPPTGHHCGYCNSAALLSYENLCGPSKLGLPSGPSDALCISPGDSGHYFHAAFLVPRLRPYGVRTLLEGSTVHLFVFQTYEIKPQVYSHGCSTLRVIYRDGLSLIARI